MNWKDDFNLATNRTKILELILKERAYQDKKFGKVNERTITIEEWVMILVDKLGGFTQAVLQHRRQSAVLDLIQVAAVVLAMLEWIWIHADKKRTSTHH